MKLEDRVNVLEKEVGVLKAEVQSTLLEIHEQILLHYYPALRADDARQVSEGPTLPTIPTSFEEDDEPEVAADLPRLRKVSLEDVRTVHGNGGSRSHPSAELVASSPQDEDRNDGVWFSELMAWTSDAVRRVGKAQTGRLVSIYAEWGHLDREAEKGLQRLIALCDEESSPASVDPASVFGVLRELHQVLDCQAILPDLDEPLNED